MRLLLDNNLSPRLVDLLTLAGWDVAHVRALGLRAATDKVVLEAARNEHRVLVSAELTSGRCSPPPTIPAPPSCSSAAWSGAGGGVGWHSDREPPSGRGGPPAGQHRRDRGRQAADPPPAHRLNTSVRTLTRFPGLLSSEKLIRLGLVFVGLCSRCLSAQSKVIDEPSVRLDRCGGSAPRLRGAYASPSTVDGRLAITMAAKLGRMSGVRQLMQSCRNDDQPIPS